MYKMLKIAPEMSGYFLEKFYFNLLFDGKYELCNDEMIIENI